MEDKITIGGLCKLSGLSLDTLKWYRELGLIEGKRDPENGYFYFSDNATFALRLIYFMRQMGISLKDIDTILSSDTNKIIELYEKQSDVIKQKIVELNLQLEIMTEQIQQYKMLKPRIYNPLELKEPEFELAYERNCIKDLKTGNEKLHQMMVKRNWHIGSLTTKAFYPIYSNGCFDFDLNNSNLTPFIAPRKSDNEYIKSDVIWRKKPTLTYICMIGLCRTTLSNNKRFPSITSNSFGTIKSGGELNATVYLKELCKFGYIPEEIVSKFAFLDTTKTIMSEYFDVYIGTRPMNKDEMAKYGISKIIPLEKLIAGEV